MSDPNRAHAPGEEVPISGVYRTVHRFIHRDEHDVTAVAGETFPKCKHCGDLVRFRLLRSAQHLSDHPYLAASQDLGTVAAHVGPGTVVS